MTKKIRGFVISKFVKLFDKFGITLQTKVNFKTVWIPQYIFSIYMLHLLFYRANTTTKSIGWTPCIGWEEKNSEWILLLHHLHSAVSNLHCQFVLFVCLCLNLVNQNQWNGCFDSANDQKDMYILLIYLESNLSFFPNNISSLLVNGKHKVKKE